MRTGDEKQKAPTVMSGALPLRHQIIVLRFANPLRLRTANAAAISAVNATPNGDSPGTGVGPGPATAVGVTAADVNDTGPRPFGCCARTVNV